MIINTKEINVGPSVQAGTSLSYSIFRKITSIKKIQHCSLTIYVYNLVLYSLSRLDAKLVNDIKIITLRT